MIANYITGIQHIGLPTEDIEKTWSFYQSLGFKKRYETVNNGNKVLFMEQKGLVLESYEVEHSAMKSGSWDHVAIDVSDIEKAYEEAHKLGYHELEKGIQFLPFFEHGVKYFTILGPNGEKVEFNQKL